MIKQKISNDYRKRKLFNSFENNIIINKLLINNKILSKENRQVLYSKQNKPISSTKIRNKCLLSGRSRGIINIFRLSRIKLKQEMFFGNISGLKMSSW